MFPAIETIQTFVAPVVMISADGLLALAFYNRLVAIVNRSRAINRERFELIARLAAAPFNSAAGQGSALGGEHALVERRIEALDELGHRLYGRARLMRDSLICLLASVQCMLACSLALGLSSLGSALAWAALTFFVAGNLVMMLGVVKAIRELRGALEPLLLEHQRLEPPEEQEG
jgi:hypothetical protein